MVVIRTLREKATFASVIPRQSRNYYIFETAKNTKRTNTLHYAIKRMK